MDASDLANPANLEHRAQPANLAGGPADTDAGVATGADDIPELYQIEKVEQLRVISDRLRTRIADLLGRRAMTVAQLSDDLGLAHAKVHYHVRELEQAGLVHLVATREKGGILEKYYRAVARVFSIAPGLLRSLPPDESVATVTEFVQQILNDALRAFALDLRQPRPGSNAGTLSETALYLTDDEARLLMGKVADLLRPYEEPRGVEGVRERTFVHLLYTTLPLEDGPAGGASAEPSAPRASVPPAVVPPVPPLPPAPPRPVRPPRVPDSPRTPGSSTRPHRRVMVVAGIVHFSRKELEQAVERGEPISLNVLGHCHFDGDIPAELAERAIARFRLRGTLSASPEVRAVITRKERPEAIKGEEEQQK
jgi:DNA-binding transcriptional ArsR family regulator